MTAFCLSSQSSFYQLLASRHVVRSRSRSSIVEANSEIMHTVPKTKTFANDIIIEACASARAAQMTFTKPIRFEF